ncbi:MAG: NAD(P)/FAD-dependent oxidoreductase [Bacteroidia bacterium]|nr:NAD(P)/FAD-dependent oxidoreductase [Bacteroidia bacterium]
MEKYDVCVIGSGPAGFAAAMRALDYGKKVVLIEKNLVGGAGVFNGALSSKTLWELSKDIRKLNVTDRGYVIERYEVDYQEITKTVHAAVMERKKLLLHQINKLQGQIYPGRFRLMRGFASVESPNTVSITDKKGNKEVVFAYNIILASGSTPRKLPTIPIDEQVIVTSDGISNFKDFPKSIVVLGAGVVGCEFATIFSNFGKTQVRLIDKAPRMLSFEDEDISKIVESNLKKNGVLFHHNASLDCMTIENGRVKYVLNYRDGSKETHYAEKALVSIGRVASFENMGLEKIGIQFTDKGNIWTDDSRTSVPNIYAVGDLTADISLVNVGELEGRHAVERIYGNISKTLKYDNISTIMFLHPEVAGVGLNEIEAQKKNINYRVATYSYSHIPRAIAMRNTNGFFKIIVTDDEEMRILGMRAIGEHASSVIEAVSLLISMNKGVSELAELIHPHPSMTEGIQECVRMLFGKSIMKPAVFTENLKCYRVVNGQRFEFHKGN